MGLKAEQHIAALTGARLPSLLKRCNVLDDTLSAWSRAQRGGAPGRPSSPDAGAYSQPAGSSNQHRAVVAMFKSLKEHSEETRALLNGTTSDAD